MVKQDRTVFTRYFMTSQDFHAIYKSYDGNEMDKVSFVKHINKIIRNTEDGTGLGFSNLKQK